MTHDRSGDCAMSMFDNAIVRPESVRLDLGEGHWLIVKKRINEGERREIGRLSMGEVRPDGRVTPNFKWIGGMAEAYVYLLDWSLMHDGMPIKIDTDEKREAGLAQLEPPVFEAVSKRIAAHIDAVEAERKAEKNAPAGDSASSATSLSAA